MTHNEIPGDGTRMKRPRSLNASKFKPLQHVNTPTDTLWTQKYFPTLVENVPVQPAKLKELRLWMLEGWRFMPVLLLTGPPGCGKSCAVRTLASSQHISILEWEDPTNPGLKLDAPQVGRIESMSMFIRRAITFPKLSLTGSPATVSKLILIDDLPLLAERSSN